MKTIVLGAGVIGMTTAYYLSREGNDVTVIDRQPGAGLETSFANGGLVTPSMSDPWAAPGLPLKLLRWIGREDAPFLLRAKAIPGLMRWGLEFLVNCSESIWRRNARAVLRISTYGQSELDILTTQTGITYDRVEAGTLRVFRDQQSMDAAHYAADMLDELGVEFTPLDSAGCVSREPALGPVAPKLTGGLFFPDDDSGDAFEFTRAVAELCSQQGVEFEYETDVHGLAANGDQIRGVHSSRGFHTADRFVIALGSHSASIAKPLGIRLPIYPVKGYSITFSKGGWNNAPNMPVVDDAKKLGVTPFGDRIRAAGTAEFNGFDLAPSRRRSEMLVDALRGLYPEFVLPDSFDVWTGLRPVTPDGSPILGKSPYRNLYLNCGQGHLGWTMACGSARIVSDIMSGRAPAIDLEDMTLDRFR